MGTIDMVLMNLVLIEEVITCMDRANTGTWTTQSSMIQRLDITIVALEEMVKELHY